MRRLLLAVAVLAAGSAASTADATAGTRATDCARSGRTMASTDRARVFRIGAPAYDVVGCLRSTGRLHRLTSYNSCECSIGDDPDPVVRLAGRMAAHTDASCDPIEGVCSGSLRSVDLRTGRTVRAVAVPDAAPFRYVLAPNGAFAYLKTIPASPGPYVTELWKVDRDGHARLDAGADDTWSLGIRGTRVRWTRDGVRRSARLR